MVKPPFILSIAGGGSTYTPGIVKSLMVRLEDFPLAEIRLYDIDAERQNTIAPVVEKVIRDHSDSIKFTVTNNAETAFRGAHFVFAQMRVTGIKKPGSLTTPTRQRLSLKGCVVCARTRGCSIFAICRWRRCAIWARSLGSIATSLRSTILA